MDLVSIVMFCFSTHCLASSDFTVLILLGSPRWAFYGAPGITKSYPPHPSTLHSWSVHLPWGTFRYLSGPWFVAVGGESGEPTWSSHLFTSYIQSTLLWFKIDQNLTTYHLNGYRKGLPTRLFASLQSSQLPFLPPTVGHKTPGRRMPLKHGSDHNSFSAQSCSIALHFTQGNRQVPTRPTRPYNACAAPLCLHHPLLLPLTHPVPLLQPHRPCYPEPSPCPYFRAWGLAVPWLAKASPQIFAEWNLPLPS